MDGWCREECLLCFSHCLCIHHFPYDLRIFLKNKYFCKTFDECCFVCINILLTKTELP